MEYRGFEVYATQVPPELVSSGTGKVFSCEVYRVEDIEMRNVLVVFDLVEGKDISAGYDAELVVALKKYIDSNYEKLMAFALFNRLEEAKNQPGFQIGLDMSYIQGKAELDVALSDEAAYILASKFEAARGNWFGTTVLHAEYLEALRDLLESGVNERNVPGFPELTPADTLKLLLTADNQVFGTLVEAAAVQSAYRYMPYDYMVPQEDREAVSRAAGQIKFPVRNVSDVISQAVDRVENETESKDNGLERSLD